MLASRMRSPADPDPTGALSRKSSGWIVPKTEMRGPGNAGSVGPACVPADLRTNPRTIAAIPTGTAPPPHRTNTSPTCPPRCLWHNVQRQRTSPDAGASKHADCGKNPIRFAGNCSPLHRGYERLTSFTNQVAIGGGSPRGLPKQVLQEIADRIVPQSGAAVERELHARGSGKTAGARIEHQHARVDVPRRQRGD